MKKLGLVGGTGPESTLLYYHDIVYGVKNKLGTDIFPELTIENINMFYALEQCKTGNDDALTEYLLKALRNLSASGSEFASLTAITMHLVYDRLKELSPLPLVSIVEAVCEEAVRRKITKAALLGTIFTMREDFFKAPFRKEGIELVTPTVQEMDLVNDRIANELEYGIVKPETLLLFQTIISRMRDEDHIQAVILGCTELPLILNDEVCPVPSLDAMKIHIKALVGKLVQEDNW